MEKSISITYNFFRQDGEEDIKHETELQEHAEERIIEMWREGFSSGQLIYEVDGIEYEGWFEINK